MLATQTLIQRPAKNMLVRVDGDLRLGVTAKDLVLAIIGKIGTAGGTGHVIEYAGEAIRKLSMEGRMTVCNMSIEAGARAGLIAPDETTFAYLRAGRTRRRAAAWEQALAFWKTLPSDPGAHYDKKVTLDAARDLAAGDLGHQARACRADHRHRSRSRRRAGRAAPQRAC